jgi:hypothetical protein
LEAGPLVGGDPHREGKMKVFLLFLVFVALGACRDGITTPPEATPFIRATGTWRGEAGEVRLTLQLDDVVSYEDFLFMRIRVVTVTGSGTYTIQSTEVTDTFSVWGRRSGAGDADIVLTLARLGQLGGAITDASTIIGRLRWFSDLESGAFWDHASGSPLVLRK